MGFFGSVASESSIVRCELGGGVWYIAWLVMGRNFFWISSFLGWISRLSGFDRAFMNL